MKKHSFIYAWLTVLLLVIGIAMLHNQGAFRTVEPLETPVASGVKLQILLIPLDSRPPCTQFVEDLGRLAGLKVLLPPAEMLDEYHQPGNKAALRTWLKENIRHADAAIISTDMLIHGGLMASRQSQGAPEDIQAVLSLLEELHRESPHTALYPFSIIPRLLLADTPANSQWQRKMLEYSVIKDQADTFENPRDIQKLQSLRDQIPPDIITRYLAMYEQSYKVNLALTGLAAKGVLAGLAIGQDDGQPFGIPNAIKQGLSQRIAHAPELENRVFITRGTDEVALTLLGHIAMKQTSRHPRVFVAYSTPQAPQTVMPYMPHSVARTVEEKIAIVQGTPTDTPANADFILYVHIGGKQTKPETLNAAANDVRHYLEQGYSIAVVDLSEDFSREDTLLPALIRADIPLSQLAAYAGWNTTSNSIGTAVTQAALFTTGRSEMQSLAGAEQQYQTQLAFLTQRFLDDWFYQKEVQPYVNRRLAALNIDPYQLGGAHDKTSLLTERLLKEKAQYLFTENLRRHPIRLNVPEGTEDLYVTGLSITASHPWPRTFEAKINPSLSFARSKGN